MTTERPRLRRGFAGGLVVVVADTVSPSRSGHSILSRSHSLPLIPVDAAIPRRAAHGDDVDLAVAVEVGRGEVFDRDPAVFDNRALPLSALAVGALVDPNAAALLERVAHLLVRVVAHADDEFVRAVAVEVREPHRVSPPQLLVDDVPVPQLPAGLRRRVRHHLIAVPRLDGRDDARAPVALA